MSHILGIGVSTLDVINSVNTYPAEDTKLRAVSQRICRGGNVSNTLVVLSQLGHCCDWAGVLVEEPDAHYVRDDLRRYNINTDACRIEAHGKIPTSYITHSLKNSSRTIVHYRNLPEFAFSDFKKIDMSHYNWLHFEGRNIDETLKMLALSCSAFPSIRRSVEIEKNRPGIEKLLPLANVLIFSRSYVLHHTDSSDARSFLQKIHLQLPEAVIYCAWGDQGAYGIDSEGIFHSPAFPPQEVVDTVGAGDTFNAGIIDASLRGLSTPDSLAFACQLAGRKCGQLGYDLIE